MCIRDRSGAIRGQVLDVGCGTGEHVLMAVGIGLGATGIDLAAAAIAVAEGKARDRGLAARFLVLNAPNPMPTAISTCSPVPQPTSKTWPRMAPDSAKDRKAGCGRPMSQAGASA